MQTLPGSRIQWHESGERLLLHLPGRSQRWLKRIGGATFVLCGFTFFFLIVVAEAPRFVLVGAAVFQSLILAVVLVVTAPDALTKTAMQLTNSRLELRTVVFGKEKTRQYGLTERSRAKQHRVELGEGEHEQGINIATKQGTAHFGDNLSPGELDWIEFRINQFLGDAANADPAAKRGRVAVPIDTMTREPVHRPDDTKIRIEERFSETRILFPNSVQLRTFAGVGHTVFGLCWTAYFLNVVVAALQSESHRHNNRGHVAVCVLFAFFGVLFLLTGLTKLFGRRSLTINPETITYRVKLLGIGPWTTLRTPEVISVGSLQRRARFRFPIAPTKGYVIRTATRELDYHPSVPPADWEWIIGEVEHRIHAARRSESAQVFR